MKFREVEVGKPIKDLIHEKRLLWYGHFHRIEDNRLKI
jgi:hypothetical protein